MRILICTIYDYPHEGGLSTHVTTLSKGLEELGHQVDILSGTQCPTWYKWYIRGISKWIKFFNTGKGQLFGDKLRMKWLEKQLKKKHIRYDVINTQDIYATIATKAYDIYTVETVHGYYTYEAISRGAIEENTVEANRAKLYERSAYNSADALVCVDQRLKQYVNKETNREAKVIHNFIDPTVFNVPYQTLTRIQEKYQLPLDKRILLIPRRLTEKNGVIYPILALPDVLNVTEDVLLVYAGSGELLETLKEKVEQLNLNNNVRLLGSVPHEDMLSLYNLSDIVIVPSIHAKGVEEATSIAALEGMAAGKPVIAGAVGGLKEMIQHGKNGLLFENKNVEEISENILNLINNSGLYKSIINGELDYINKHHTHLSAAKNFVKIYKKQGQN